MHRRRHRAAVALAAALMLLAAPARAGNQRAAFVGNEAALTAGALIASTREAAAAWYNPAGLGGLARSRLELSASAFVLRLQRVERAIEVTLPSGRYPQEIGGNEFLLVPAALVFCRQLSGSLTLGLGVYALDARDLRFTNDFARPGGTLPLLGAVNYAHGLEAQALSTTYYLGPALGWQVTPSLRLGVALHAIYFRQLVSSKLFVEGRAVTGGSSAFFSSSASSDLRALGFTASGGLQWAPSDHLQLGLVVRSPSVALHGWSEGATVSTSALPFGTPTLTSQFTDVDEGAFDAFAPMRIEAAAALLGARYTLGLAFELAPPLRVTEARFKVDTKTTWNVRAGGKVRVSDTLTLGAGFYTDRSGQRAIELFFIPRMDYYGFTCGLGRETRFEIKGRGLRFSTVVGLGYAFAVGEIGGLDVNLLNLAAPTALRERPAVFHELSLHVGSGLAF